MEIDRDTSGEIIILRLDGDLDEGSVDVLRNALFECISSGRCSIVMNLSQVRFISYMGLGVLVERLRHIRKTKGDIKLVGMNLYAERLFRMVGVSALFEYYDSEDSALLVFQKAA
jgi:anti-anti-sigma factor